ncbi:MAG: ferritin-like protein [Candidatus Hydrogenedentes bacterium]|nr:ferritin-like protein [Candidatus Hydrogenedentota bacterium]
MLYLRSELFADLDSITGLRVALQKAIELEHATIPLYLYAFYSIRPGANAPIARIILSVAMEEMLHFALACNLLNAIGGTPVIDDPSFMPVFPGPLPGTVQHGLVARLAPISRELVKDVFMEIEEPEDPLQFPTRPLDITLDSRPTTIGQFYRRIRDHIKAGGSGLFIGPANRQITADAALPGMVAVTDITTALQAIDTIVEQGEGTDQAPIDREDDLAHYYKFAQIYHGRRLIADASAPPTAPPDQRYVYGGAPITFDPAGVYPLPTNPRAASYPEEARERAEEFNRAYTRMLGHLQRATTGNPSEMGLAIGIMKYELGPLAKQIVRIPISETQNAGPTFEYTR